MTIHYRLTLDDGHVAGDDVITSTNHPLAGQRLSFKVRVIDVRKTTAKQPAADAPG